MLCYGGFGVYVTWPPGGGIRPREGTPCERGRGVRMVPWYQYTVRYHVRWVPRGTHLPSLFSIILIYFLISFSVIAITSLRDISLRDIVVATTSLRDTSLCDFPRLCD